MYTGARPGVSPAIRAGKGVVGTPGACSQVFCHPIRCMLVMRYRQRYVINTQSVPPPPPPRSPKGTEDGQGQGSGARGELRAPFLLPFLPSSSPSPRLPLPSPSSTTATTSRFSSCVAFVFALPFTGTPMVDIMADVEHAAGGVGNVLRRRERRLRAMLRHERQSIAMVLATVSHHSSGKVDTANGASRRKSRAACRSLSRRARSDQGLSLGAHRSLLSPGRLRTSASVRCMTARWSPSSSSARCRSEGRRRRRSWMRLGVSAPRRTAEWVERHRACSAAHKRKRKKRKKKTPSNLFTLLALPCSSTTAVA